MWFLIKLPTLLWLLNKSDSTFWVLGTDVWDLIKLPTLLCSTLAPGGDAFSTLAPGGDAISTLAPED